MHLQEVVAINLANQHGSEGLLGQKMAEQADRFSQNNPGLRLVPFDFHKECGTSRYDRYRGLGVSTDPHLPSLSLPQSGDTLRIILRGVVVSCSTYFGSY